MDEDKYAAYRQSIYKEIQSYVKRIKEIVNEVILEKPYNEKEMRTINEILVNYLNKIRIRKVACKNAKRYNELEKYSKLEEEVMKLRHELELHIEKFNDPLMYY